MTHIAKIPTTGKVEGMASPNGKACTHYSKTGSAFKAAAPALDSFFRELDVACGFDPMGFDERPCRQEIAYKFKRAMEEPQNDDLE